MVEKIKRPQTETATVPKDTDHHVNQNGATKRTSQTHTPQDPIKTRDVTVVSGMTSSISNYIQYLLGVNVESKFSELLNKNTILKQAYLLNQFTHDDFKRYFMGEGNGKPSHFQENFYLLVENSPLFAEALVSGMLHQKHFSKLPKETAVYLMTAPKMQERLIKIIHLRAPDTDDIIRDVLADAAATKMILDDPSILKNIANLEKDVRKILFSSVPLLIFYLTHKDHKLSPEAFGNIHQHIGLLERLRDSPDLLSLGTQLPFSEMIRLLENPFALFLIQNKMFLEKLIAQQSIDLTLNQLTLRDAEDIFDINLLPILLDIIPVLRNRVLKQHVTMEELMEIPISLAISLISHQQQHHASKAAIDLNRILMDPNLFRQLLKSPQLLQKCLDDRDFSMAIKALHKNNELQTLLSNPEILELILIKPELITRRQFADMKSLQDFAVLIKVSPSLNAHFEETNEDKALYFKLSIEHKKIAQANPHMIPYLALKEEITMKSFHALIPQENLHDIPMGDIIDIEGIVLTRNPFKSLTLDIDQAKGLCLKTLDLLFKHRQTVLKMMQENKTDFLQVAQSPDRLEKILNAPSVERERDS
ncbi:MAG: hypothetical protein KBE16_03250 [Alphaproteobacteria bacterium]|jgi:hypothetical protein|nr:hypothetical protein [Alphaproteobacteria bacterium]MBP9877053.1 hypothetical protein [Alphaproteobacteria bacterium]